GESVGECAISGLCRPPISLPSFCSWGPITWSMPSYSAPRFSRLRCSHAAGESARRLIDVDGEPHLWVNGAKHLEIARCRKRDVSPAARLLIPGVECEFR